MSLQGRILTWLSDVAGDGRREDANFLERARGEAAEFWLDAHETVDGAAEEVTGFVSESRDLVSQGLDTAKEAAQLGGKTADAAVVGFTETTKMTLIVASSVVLLGILALFATTRGGR